TTAPADGSVVKRSDAAVGPAVRMKFEGAPKSVRFVAQSSPWPVPSNVTVVPSAEKVDVPGPEALTVIVLPVVLFVRLSTDVPVILYEVEPSGFVVTFAYSRSTSGSTWTAKPQTVAGTSNGAAAR